MTTKTIAPAVPALVYLASRFSRIEEMRQRSADLAEMGIVVTSRWIRGGHEWDGIDDEEIPIEEAARFAREDLEDIDRADMVICFTEPPRSSASRGGRHVELGYALGKKPIVIVGYRENVFCTLPEVTFFPQWDARCEMFLRNWSLAHVAGEVDGILDELYPGSK
jgi:nucleoside 2-deoxyribosyltransferase